MPDIAITLLQLVDIMEVPEPRRKTLRSRKVNSFHDKNNLKKVIRKFNLFGK